MRFRNRPASGSSVWAFWVLVVWHGAAAASGRTSLNHCFLCCLRSPRGVCIPRASMHLGGRERMIQFLTQHHLLGYLTDVARLSAWLVLLIVIFLPLERLFGLSPRKFFQKSVAVDVGYYFLNGLVPA